MGIDTTLLNDKNKAKPKPKTIAGFKEEVRGCKEQASSYTILMRSDDSSTCSARAPRARALTGRSHLMT